MAQFDGRIRVKIGANITELEKGLNAAQKSLTKFSKQLNDIGKNFSVAFTAPLALIGTAAITAANKIKDALNDVAVGTGATGAALEGLKDDFRAVAAQVPNDISQSAKAVADLNTMLGVSGTELQRMAVSFLDLSRITKSDLGANISSITKLMNNWSIQTSKAGEILDKLLVASQNTGVSIDAIATGITQTGGALREAGFSIEQSMALFGQLDKSGMNVTQIIGGLNIAMKKLAQNGVKDFATVFKEIFTTIKNDTNLDSAVNKAVEMFGKSGVAWAEALRSGRFEIDELTNTINDATGSLKIFTDETATFQDKINVIKNQLSLALEPLGNHIIQIALEYMPELSDATGKLAIDFSDTTIKAGLLVAGLGPLILVLGSVTAAISSLIGTIKLLIGFFTGPVGLMIALSGISIALLEYTGQIKRVEDSTDKTSQAMAEFSAQIRTMTLEQLNAELVNSENVLRGFEGQILRVREQLAALENEKSKIQYNTMIYSSFGGGEVFTKKVDEQIYKTNAELRELEAKIKLNQEQREEIKKRIDELNNPVQISKTVSAPVVERAGRGGGKASRSSRGGGVQKSPIDDFIQTSRDKIKYLDADGREFLEKLDEFQAKTKILSEDWKKLEDFRISIDDTAFNEKIQSIQDKIKYLNADESEFLPELKELSAQYDLLSDKGKRLADTIKQIEENAYSEKWQAYAWEFSQGLLKGSEYAALLKEELGNLQINTDKWREKFAEFQNVQTSETQRTIEALNEQFTNGTINGDLYQTALQSIIDEFAEFPKVAELAAEALKRFHEQANKAGTSTAETLSNALQTATTDFQNLQAKGILGVINGLVQAAVYNEDFGDSLKKLGQEIVAETLKMLILQMVMKAFGFNTPSIDVGGIGNIFNIKATSARGNVLKFAHGGIVNRPTVFPMQNGLGLMGEVPGKSEAIMPLSRDSQGRLGVYANNLTNQAPTVIVNVENQSSQPVNAQQSYTTFDEQFNKAVVQVILRDQATNGPISRNYRK